MENKQIQTLHIDQVNVGEEKTAKNNKIYQSVGIKCGDQWHNNIFWEGKGIDVLKAAEGKDLQVVTYEEEYNGNMQKKFKLPSGLELVVVRVEKLEQVIDVLIDRLDKSAAVMLEMQKRLDAIESNRKL